MKKIIVLLSVLLGFSGFGVAQLRSGRPVIIEIVIPKGQFFKAGYFSDMKDYGITDIKRWKDRVVVYAHTNRPLDLQDRIRHEYSKMQVLRFDYPFYQFDRSHCDNKNSAGEWDNIIMTANLVNDAKLQKEYLDYHKTQFEKWPEVSNGFCNARFQQLLVFRNGRQLMLVISIPKGESLDKLNPLTSKDNPRVNAWNKKMQKYQEGITGTKPGEVWVLFKPISEKEFME